MGTGKREGPLLGEVKCNSVSFACGHIGVSGYFLASFNKEPVIPFILYFSFRCVLCHSTSGLLLLNRISCFIRGSVLTQ